MPFSHDFRILFTVHGSDRSDGMDLSGEAMLEALKSRVAEFEANPQLLRDLAGAPQSSKEQGYWVLRKIGEPGQIRKSDGGWIPAEPGEIRKEDMLRSEEAATIPAPQDGFWCRYEDVFEAEVLADLHSDDHVITTHVNILPWLAMAEPGEIEELEAESWGYCEAADQVAYALERLGDPGAQRLFNYLGLSPRMSFTGDPVGFGLTVLESDVTEWLAGHRPDVFEKLMGEEDGPSP